MIVKGGYNLTIEIQRKFFDSLPTEKVGHTCFEPMVPVYQNGMRHLLSEIEQAFTGEEKNDMLDSRIDELYSRLQEISPCVLMQIGVYIKENPTEFICFE